MNRFIFLITLIILIVLGWSAAWFYAATRISDEANAFFARTQQTQQQIACLDFNIAGYPFRFDVTCINLTLTDLDLSLTVPQIKASVLVYRPTHFLVFADGPANLVDNFSGSKRRLSWDNLRLSLRTSGWALARFSLTADTLELSDLLIGKTLIANIGHLEAHLLANENQAENQQHQGEIIALASIEQGNAPEFDVENADIKFEASISSMPDDIRQWTLALIADNWYKQQTGATIVKFDGTDEISSFSINGNITTTKQSMLSGNFDFFSTNFAQRFANLLDPDALNVVFGRQSENAEHYQSYSLVHGVLLAGNIPILTFGPMR